VSAAISIGVVPGAAPTQGLRKLDPEQLGDHVDRLFRAAWALCGNREDAEDLVQELYANVLRRPRWLRGEDDFGYLLRGLRNAFASRQRAGRRRPATVGLDQLPELDDARRAWQPDRSAEVGELFAAIARLPEPYREALVAVDVAGLTYAEAARALRTREATITSRLHRARARVASELAP
jgi:RNA polymerase sigma-70 factor (ECF subfamily)